MFVPEKERPPIIVDAEKCQGCLICIMRCGLRFDKLFNPEASKITVTPYLDRAPEISFKEHCDRCGICVRHCPSGALSSENRDMA